jgi:hypothetical protein
MAAETTPPKSASPDKVVELLVAQRERLQKGNKRFRFRWSFLITACVVGVGIWLAIDLSFNQPVRTLYMALWAMPYSIFFF